MEELKKLRLEIDIIDDEIMNLLNKRLSVVSKVSKVKKRNNLSVLDSNREMEVLNKLSGFKYSNELIDIYKYIMKVSKEMQK